MVEVNWDEEAELPVLGGGGIISSIHFLGLLLTCFQSPVIENLGSAVN
jgi:hypothetical protein